MECLWDLSNIILTPKDQGKITEEGAETGRDRELEDCCKVVSSRYDGYCAVNLGQYDCRRPPQPTSSMDKEGKTHQAPSPSEKP